MVIVQKTTKNPSHTHIDIASLDARRVWDGHERGFDDGVCEVTSSCCVAVIYNRFYNE